MNVATLAPPTQDLWEEIRQEAMKNAPQTVTAAKEQDVPGIAEQTKSTGGDGVATIIERIKAQRKKAASASAAETGTSPAEPGVSTVATALENVGPNTFERLRTNAGRTYLAQAENYGTRGAVDKDPPGCTRAPEHRTPGGQHGYLHIRQHHVFGHQRRRYRL